MTAPQPISLALYSPLATRDGTVALDSHLVNGFVEKSQERAAEGQEAIWVYRRPGLISASAYGTGRGRGVTNWGEEIYAIFGDQLYRSGVSVGTVNATGKYTFTSCLGATPKLFLKNELFAYTYDPSGGLVQVTDPNYPALTVPGCVYLDGTIYVLTPTSQLIGSDFNDPQSWDPLNVIIVQVEPDEAIALAKQLVYVVALKKISAEVFHDAGNATGSPLAPVLGSKMNTGCRHAGTMADVGGDVAWLGTDKMGSVKVMYMEAVKGKQISAPPVERLLQSLTYDDETFSCAFACNGHRYYVLTVGTSDLTLVFDLESGAWYIWTDGSGHYFPIIASTYDAAGNPILQHRSNGKTYTIDISATTDAGTTIPFQVYTPIFDGGAKINKTVSLIELVADWVDTEMAVSWSDDDYATYTTEQNVSLAQEHPIIPDGSTFRRRSYRVTNADDVFFRLKAIQLTVSGGTL